jgi:hypothetical protein
MKMGSSSIKWSILIPFKQFSRYPQPSCKGGIFTEKGDLLASLVRKNLLSSLLKKPLRDLK